MAARAAQLMLILDVTVVTVALSQISAATATASLIYALVHAEERGWTATSTTFLLVALALHAALLRRETTADAPLTDLRPLARRPITVGLVAIALATALTITIVFLGTSSYQHHRGLSAFVTGLLFLPVAPATMIGATVVARLVRQAGIRIVGVAGLLLASAGLSLPALLDTGTALTIGTVVASLGTGSRFVVASASVLGHVTVSEAALAAGILSIVHELGASLGVATASAVAALLGAVALIPALDHQVTPPTGTPES